MKSLTKLTLATAAGVVLTSAIQAAPLVSLGDGMDLYFNGAATIRNESNVLQSSSEEESDTVFIFSPGLELVVGRPDETDFAGRLLYRQNFMRYSSLNEDDATTAADENLDASFTDVTAEATLTNGATTYDGSVRFYQTQSNSVSGGVDGSPDTPVIGAAIERDVTSINNYVELEFSPKTSFGMGLDYNSVDYDESGTLGYTDSSNWSVPADFYYEISPKIDLSLSYRYRSVDVESTQPDAVDQFLMIGLRGQLTPKLKGFLKVGAVHRSPDEGDSETEPSVSMNLSYQATPLLEMGANAYRDFGVAQTGGATTIRTGAALRAKYNISPMFHASGRIGLYRTEYPTRDDDFYSMGVSMTYTPNEYVSVSGGYTYANNASSSDPHEFKNNILELSAMFRY